MLSYYFQGLALGAAMILPLGPQNAFVMNGHSPSVPSDDCPAVCGERSAADLRRDFGGSALLMQSPWLLALVTGRRSVSAVVRVWCPENGHEQQS